MAHDRLSPLDASFLHLEDEVSHMHIGSVGIFEGPPPPYGDLVDAIAAKIPTVPRYRQVVRRIPADLGRPVWLDDPHFHPSYHVRATALPAPGGTAELRRLVGRVMSQALDRTKPLWEFWMVEGLGDGRWATIAKTHHCMVDGVAGAELLAAIMDLSPEHVPAAPDDWVPEPWPSGTQLACEAVVDTVRSPYEQLRAARAATRVPRQALRQLLEVGRGLGALAGVVRPTPPTSLNGPIGPHRRWVWAEATVDDVKRVRKGLGGTFNDVVLTVITAGLRTLLRSRGEPTHRVLRTLVPVSVRSRSDSGMAVGDGTMENRVSAIFAELPVDEADPLSRLEAVSAQMAGLKESKEALAGEALTSLSVFAPHLLLALGTRIGTKAAQRNVNTVTTNVPGPQFPLFLLGRRMEAAYPFVPLGAQMRLTVAIFSYDGQLTFGITGDYDAAADIEVLARGIEDGLAELVALAT